MSTLHQDKLIEITDQEVIFRRYYFPSGGPKRMAWSEIESVRLRPPSVRAGSWRLWGSGDLRTWFPLDHKRPSRDRIFVASLRGRSRRIGFTVERSSEVIGILKQKGLLRETP